MLVLDAGIILLFVIFMRRFVRHDHAENIAMEKLEELLQPTLTEAKSISYKLEVLLKEKQKLIFALTDKLDQKIDQVNAALEQPVNRRRDNTIPSQGKSRNFKEFQDDAIHLSRQGFSADQIALKLGVNRNEVDLVLSLRKNIEQVRDITVEMEKNDTLEKTKFTQPAATKKSPIIKDILQKKTSKPSRFAPTKTAKSTKDTKQQKSGITFESRPNSDAINADEILKLSRSGLQSNDIAKKLGIARGEVDLVLNLKNKFQTIGQNYNKLNAYK